MQVVMCLQQSDSAVAERICRPRVNTIPTHLTGIQAQATGHCRWESMNTWCFNFSKTGPPSEISPPPFLNEIVAKGCFSLESMPTYLCHSTYCYVEQEAVLEGLTNEGWHHLHKQMYDKNIADSLHVYINRARPVCKVGILHIFERNITTLDNMPTLLFGEPLQFITHQHTFESLR